MALFLTARSTGFRMMFFGKCKFPGPTPTLQVQSLWGQGPGMCVSNESPLAPVPCVVLAHPASEKYWSWAFPKRNALR